jgi:hypothetical protein
VAYLFFAILSGFFLYSAIELFRKMDLFEDVAVLQSPTNVIVISNDENLAKTESLLDEKKINDSD